MSERCDLGLIGLGVMGRNFLLNLADHGFAVAGHDLAADKVASLEQERDESHTIVATADLDDFVASLKRPRAVMLLVPAGDPVDSVLHELRPRLAAGDVVVDGGNSHFVDTARRLEELAAAGIHYLGTGVSGGAEGARHGPSLMPGGPRPAWERMEPLLTKAAAKVDGDPCVAWLGHGAAGHYVKMVHNGIEYGLMQLIAEAYDILRRGHGLDAGAIAGVFSTWAEGPLAGFLVELTARVLTVRDPDTGRPLVDLVRDAAHQKGTGQWTSQESLELRVPTPTIDAAVIARNLSALVEQRERAARMLKSPQPSPAGGVESLGDALFAATLLTYAQGFALLHRASSVHEYDLDLANVARIWRGGCIIRAALLEDIRSALAAGADRPNLLLHESFASLVERPMPALRETVALAANNGIPTPAFAASLAYRDGLASAGLPANLIQAQRDAFGSHGYQRTDRDGDFHTDWSAPPKEDS